MKNRSGEKIKLASIDELLGVVKMCIRDRQCIDH